jgi:toxin ParE1/3/4
MKLKISKAASQDIENIYLYGFLTFGEGQADVYMCALSKRFELLCSNPEIGRLDARVNPAVRRFDFESHIIFYDAEDDHILVVRVLHKSMDFVKHLSA